MTDLGYGLASFLVRTLPPRATETLADLASEAYMLAHPRRTRALSRMLARIEGAPAEPRETYRTFARALRDFLAERDTRVRLSAPAREALDAARRQGRGAVLVSGHFGPWERALQWLAEERGGVEALAARHRHASVDRFFVARRARGGVRTLCSTRPVAGALQSLKAGGWIAALADRPRRAPAMRADSLVPLDPGPLLLARRAGALVLPGVASFGGDGGLEVGFHAPFTLEPEGNGIPLEEGLAVLQRFFDAHVRSHPTQWFAWGA